ncbi:MAG: carboxymuconolactone decarboxylase family protein [Enhydrobacter sp.]|nr:MAG: carboxymuconolactone decarboxylase family protein [Enhydrobacter sp.]
MDINSARAAETTEGGLDKLAELPNWRDSKLFSQAERVALEYAERITYTDRQVDDALFAEVKKHFSEAQIVELTAAIAFENFRSKFNPALGIEAQGFCLVPTRPKAG